MSGQMAVDTEVLRRHGARVAQVADDVQTAHAAIGSTDLHGGAFGVLCSFLPAIVGSVESSAREAIEAVRDDVRDAVDGLNSMARSFEAVDDLSHTMLTTISRALDR